MNYLMIVIHRVGFAVIYTQMLLFRTIFSFVFQGIRAHASSSRDNITGEVKMDDDDDDYR